MAAGTIGLESVTPVKLLLDNMGATHAVFEAATTAGCPRVVFSSTAFTYGWCHDPIAMVPKELPISNPSDAQPHETYGLSKVCCEEIASMLARCSHNATGFVSLRFTNIVKRELFPEVLPFPVRKDISPIFEPRW